MLKKEGDRGESEDGGSLAPQYARTQAHGRESAIEYRLRLRYGEPTFAPYYDAQPGGIFLTEAWRKSLERGIKALCFFVFVTEQYGIAVLAGVTDHI